MPDTKRTTRYEWNLTRLELDYSEQIPCQAYDKGPRHFATLRETFRAKALQGPAFYYWCDRHAPKVED